MTNSKSTFIEGCFYHVFNRSNNKEALFRNDSNHYFFLKQFERYLSPYMECYAFCLMANHFHFLLKCKRINEIEAHLNKIPKPKLIKCELQFLLNNSDPTNYHKLIRGQFHRLFTCYTLSFNNYWKRQGNLFYRPYKHKIVDSDLYLNYLIYYIHRNPEKHTQKENWKSYNWSSYYKILTNNTTWISVERVFELFHGKENFKKFHALEPLWEQGFGEE